MSTTRRVLLVGNYRHVDFAGAVAELNASAQLTKFTSVAEALEWLTGNDTQRPVVDEVILAQSRPGEILDEEVNLLRRAAPLARFIALLGSWCEGEARTGRPWPDVERRYWHSFPVVAEPDSRVAGGGAERRPSSPGASKTQPPATPHSSAVRDITLGIYAWRFEDYEALATALKPLARTLLWLDPRRLPLVDALDLILWDGRYGDDDELAELAAVRERYHSPPLVALFSFPRHEAAAAAKQLGATAVLGKPFRLNSLQAAVLNSLRVAI